MGQFGDDYLVGSDDSSDLIDGGEGHDRIEGLAGNDVLRGGPGDDQLMGGDGDDFMEGGAGSDVLFGQAHHDRLFGHAQTSSDDDNAVDHLYGDFGTNLNEPLSGRDQLDGNGGSNLLYGEAGDDFLAPGVHVGNRIDYGFRRIVDPIRLCCSNAYTLPCSSLDSDRQCSISIAIGFREKTRWGQLGFSAVGAGLGSKEGLAIESSITASTTNSFLWRGPTIEAATLRSW